MSYMKHVNELQQLKVDTESKKICYFILEKKIDYLVCFPFALIGQFSTRKTICTLGTL